MNSKILRFVAMTVLCLSLMASLTSPGATAELAGQRTTNCTCRICIAARRNSLVCGCADGNTALPGVSSLSETGTAPSESFPVGSETDRPDGVVVETQAEETSANMVSDELVASLRTTLESEINPAYTIFGHTTLTKPGSQDIKHLQMYLNKYFHEKDVGIKVVSLQENGVFDDDTQFALIVLQIEQGVEEHGIVGDETKTRLYELMGDFRNW